MLVRVFVIGVSLCCRGTMRIKCMLRVHVVTRMAMLVTMAVLNLNDIPAGILRVKRTAGVNSAEQC
mgnify:CR=1 FL=1